MKCVVTGGTGFLGSRLTQRLKREGHEVRVVSRSSGHDITRPETLAEPFRGARVVFHLAALVRSRPGPFDEVNLTGLENVLKEAQKNQIDRFVNVSSFTVFGPSGDGVHSEGGLPRRERFFHGYDRTKFEGYQLAREWKDRVPMNVVFPTVVFGPGPLTEGNILIRLFQRWHKLRIAALPLGGAPIWNFVFVEDVVDGLMRSLQAPAGEEFILGGQDVSLRELCRLYREASDRRIAVLGLGPIPFKLGAHFEDVLSRITGSPPLVLPATVDFFLSNWRFSSDKARDGIGYSPRPLEQAMESTYRWMSADGIV